MLVGTANTVEPILLSVNDAASALGTSRPTLYKLLNSGSLRAVKLGGRTMIPTQALREYAASLAAYAPGIQGEEKVKQAAPALAAPVADRMLRIKAVMDRTGLGKTSIYGQLAAGKFPRQIPLGGRASGWRESDVDAWIADPSGYMAKP